MSISVKALDGSTFEIDEFGRCPFCVREGKLSRVTDRGGMITLLGFQPFYDENGVRHSHDPNNVRTGYSCTNGHLFKMTHKRECPSCAYGRDACVIEELAPTMKTAVPK